LWTALVSLLTGLVFGLAPAWQSSPRLNLNEALRDGGRSTTESAGKRRWRNLFVITELALALMLLTGSGPIDQEPVANCNRSTWVSIVAGADNATCAAGSAL